MNCNLVITSEDKENLNLTKKQIEEQYNIQVFAFTFDLSRQENAFLLFHECKSKKLQIDLLINNAGISLNTNEMFNLPERTLDMLNVMLVSLTSLCILFSNEMKKQRKGYILNIASINAFFPNAEQLLYGVIKNYVKNFSEALHWELKKDNVIVTCLAPGGTKTNFFSNNSIFIEPSMKKYFNSPENVAKYGLKVLFKKKKTKICGKLSKFAVFLLKLIPDGYFYKLGKKHREKNQKPG